LRLSLNSCFAAQGKPAERQGRKAAGLRLERVMAAGLPARIAGKCGVNPQFACHAKQRQSSEAALLYCFVSVPDINLHGHQDATAS